MPNRSKTSPQPQRPQLDDNEVHFLVGVMSGWKPEPDPLLDAWEALERRADEQAMMDEKLIEFPGMTRSEETNSSEGGPEYSR